MPSVLTLLHAGLSANTANIIEESVHDTRAAAPISSVVHTAISSGVTGELFVNTYMHL